MVAGAPQIFYQPCFLLCDRLFCIRSHFLPQIPETNFNEKSAALYCQMIKDKATRLFSRLVTLLLHIFSGIDVFALGFRLIALVPLRGSTSSFPCLWTYEALMKPLRCLSICFNSRPGGCLQVQPHLGIVPQEWLWGGCAGSTLEKQESRPVDVSCCRRDIVFLIKFFDFLIFSCCFCLVHNYELCCMPPVKTVYEDQIHIWSRLLVHAKMLNPSKKSTQL